MVPWTKKAPPKMNKSPGRCAISKGNDSLPKIDFQDMLGLWGKRPAPPGFPGPIFLCFHEPKKKQMENTWMFSAEVMTSKILVDEFQYEENICLNSVLLRKNKNQL